MEISQMRGFTELGMEDPYVNIQWPMNSSVELTALPMTAAFGENLHHSFLHSMYDIRPPLQESCAAPSRPMKQIKTNGWSSERADLDARAIYSNDTNQHDIVKPYMESLPSNGTTTSPTDTFTSQGSYENQNYVLEPSQCAKKNNTRGRLSQAQDHIMAERKRREKLSQKFIALAALVPGLKKMDKASVLGDAVKYLKELQERVNTLEEQSRKKSMECVFFVNKYEVDDQSSSDEQFSDIPAGEPFPEVEARFSDKDVLIRIHCEKRKGVREKIIAELEKFQLLVVNNTAMTFGSSALDITIIAQINEKFTMTAKDLVNNLRAALKQLL